MSTTLRADIAFRKATDPDRPFLFRVYASSREEELARVLWSPEEKRAFLEQQFHAQDHEYKLHYRDADFLIVLVAGREAGRLYVGRAGDEILVIDIALLPEERGRGVGTSILSALVAEADESGRSMSLHVEPYNPALRLYKRLGFRVEENLTVYLRLGRPAGGTGPGGASSPW